MEKQAAGIQVNLIYDSIGCMNTPKEFFKRLNSGGIKVLEFNPINPLTGNKKEWLLNNRDHRKLLVVDGRIAFLGGINISESYSSSPSTKSARKKCRGFLELSGSVAHELSAFSALVGKRRRA